eukprot:scaffold4069_cov85-Cyclotella_meneghiniana.AAC.6
MSGSNQFERTARLRCSRVFSPTTAIARDVPPPLYATPNTHSSKAGAKVAESESGRWETKG